MKPSPDHRGGRHRITIEFDMPTYLPTRANLCNFIKDALEIWGGQRHPDYNLFASLGRVTVKTIEKITPLRK